MVHPPIKSISMLVPLVLLLACQSNQKSDLKSEPVKKDTVSTTAARADTASRRSSTELDFLNDFRGKYPHDVKLFDNEILKSRLTKLLGGRFSFLKKIWQVETPMEVNDNLFYAWAMEAHSGGDPGAVVMADLNKNVLYAGIRENAQVKLYSEDGTEAPKKLQDWSHEQ